MDLKEEIINKANRRIEQQKILTYYLDEIVNVVRGLPDITLISPNGKMLTFQMIYKGEIETRNGIVDYNANECEYELDLVLPIDDLENSRIKFNLLYDNNSNYILLESICINSGLQSQINKNQIEGKSNNLLFIKINDAIKSLNDFFQINIPLCNDKTFTNNVYLTRNDIELAGIYTWEMKFVLEDNEDLDISDEDETDDEMLPPRIIR